MDANNNNNNNNNREPCLSQPDEQHQQAIPDINANKNNEKQRMDNMQ